MTYLAQNHHPRSTTLILENPDRYILQIFWDALEDHTLAFRQGPLFAEWRALVGGYSAAPPVVEHFNLVTQS